MPENIGDQEISDYINSLDELKKAQLKRDRFIFWQCPLLAVSGR